MKSMRTIPAVAILAVLTACGRPSPVYKSAPSPKAVIVDLRGEVTVHLCPDTPWKDAELGSALEAAAEIKTGAAAYCELDLDGFASVALQAHTQASLHSLVLGSSSRQAEVRLNSGALTSRVEKLAAGETFRVRTDAAICGVRGTEFTVRVEADGRTSVAVREGGVVLLPPSLAETDMDLAPELMAALDAAAPLVAAGSEVSFDAALFAEADRIVRDLREGGLNPGAEELDRLTEAVSAAVLHYSEPEAAPPIPDSSSSADPGPALVDLVLIPGGSFRMGPEDGAGAVRVVELAPFYLARRETTQEEYRKLMGTLPGEFRGGPDLPADGVTWYDAAAYCNALSVAEGLQPAYLIEAGEPASGGSPQRFRVGLVPGSSGYRLPTEAEWEYACRAGTQSPYFWGETREPGDAYAWHAGNSGNRTHPVGTKEPNPWGLYDMIGNVWEFVWDEEPSAGEDRIVVKGQAWDGGLESSGRGAVPRYYTDSTHGFRVARSVP